MPTYDTSRAYCVEADVFAVGRYTWTDSPATAPTATQVEGFAYSSAAEVVQATRRAGAETLPPASSIGDVYTRQQLVNANATGAAYFAWRAAAATGDKFAQDMRDSLREDWIQYVGGMNSAGKQIPGTIVTTLQAVNNVLVMHNDQLDGYSKFPASVPAETLGRKFTSADVD